MKTSQEQARDAVIELRTFTRDGLAQLLKCSIREANEHIDRMLQRGTIIDVGFLRNGKRGRPPRVYCWTDPKIFHRPHTQHSRPRGEPPERLAINQIPKSQAPSGKKKGRGVQKDLRQLLREVESRPNWSVDWNRTHPAVLAPDGSVVTHVPTTPSDFRAIKNAIAAIKRKERSLG